MNLISKKSILLSCSIMFFSLASFHSAYANEVIEVLPGPGSDVIEVCELSEEEILHVESLQAVNSTLQENENIEEVPSTEDSYTSLGNFKLTAYCACAKCNWPYVNAPTAYGTDYVEGRTIAVDKRVIPLGTWVEINIPGEGWHAYRAEDTGGKIKGNRIDIFVNGHNNCNQSRYNTTCEVRIKN